MSTTLDDVMKAVQALRVDVQALRAALDDRRPGASANAGGLLRAIVGHVAHDFTVAEILETAEVDAELRGAVIGAIGSLNAYKVGHLLAEIERKGLRFDGLSVRRVRRIGNATLWAITDQGASGV